MHDSTLETGVRPTQEKVWTVQEIMGWSKNFLERQGIDRPRLDVEYLLGHTLEMNRVSLYCYADRPLSLEERSKFKDLLVRRGNGEPLAYLLGTQPFMGFDFFVTEDVLIPRIDSEVLVERSIELCKENFQEQSIKVLEVGTGSGCLIISLVKALESVTAEAWDISKMATEIAIQNAENLNVSERIKFRERDALDVANWQLLWDNPVELIISNPPYIKKGDSDLEESVSDYEPDLALYAEKSGLKFYSFFAQNAHKALQNDGLIVVEIGHQQGEEVSEIFLQQNWREVQVYNDTQGLNRVVVARRPT